MKVLWITNILFPEAIAHLMGINELKSSGGWLLGAASALIEKSDVSLCVTSVSSLVSKLTKIEGEKISYYIIPYGKGNLRENPDYELYWKQIYSEVCPDIVHIYGTEFSHGLSYMRVCDVDNVVVSIQGLTSVIQKYYCSAISKKEILKNITLRDIFRGTILKDQREFERRSQYEREILKQAKHIIGRTSWDKAHIRAINPNATYHFCNETLREEFYDGSLWRYDNCHKYTIFLSQAGYPIKGLHQVLKAMPLILRHYPKTVIRVAGRDITKCDTLKDLFHFTGYGLYIKRLIYKFNLQNHISFIGNLNAHEMKKEYLNCNVFVCPSSIENSPNSLGEAQILGVPCVASYVGGIPDMMKGMEDNLYRFEEVEMLAKIVCGVFENNDRQNVCPSIALKRHNRDINRNTLIEVYKKIKLDRENTVL